MRHGREAIIAALGGGWSAKVINECVSVASDASGVAAALIHSRVRTKNVAHARQVSIWLAHSRGVRNCEMTDYFGLDNSTINYAITAAQKRHDANMERQEADNTQRSAET